MTNRTVAFVATGLNRLPPITAFSAAPTMLRDDGLTTRTGRGLLLTDDDRETLPDRRLVNDKGSDTLLPGRRGVVVTVRRGVVVDGRGEVLTG